MIRYAIKILVWKAYGAYFHFSCCVACLNLACVIQQVSGCFLQTVSVAPQWVYHMIFTIILHSYASSLRYFTLSFLPQNLHYMLTLQPFIAITCYIANSHCMKHLCGQFNCSLGKLFWRWWSGIKMSHMKMKIVCFFFFGLHLSMKHKKDEIKSNIKEVPTQHCITSSATFQWSYVKLNNAQSSYQKQFLSFKYLIQAFGAEPQHYFENGCLLEKNSTYSI